jgi:hypothetical protein
MEKSPKTRKPKRKYFVFEVEERGIFCRDDNYHKEVACSWCERDAFGEAAITYPEKNKGELYVFKVTTGCEICWADCCFFHAIYDKEDNKHKCWDCFKKEIIGARYVNKL